MNQRKAYVTEILDTYEVQVFQQVVKMPAPIIEPESYYNQPIAE